MFRPAVGTAPTTTSPLSVFWRFRAGRPQAMRRGGVVSKPVACCRSSGLRWAKLQRLGAPRMFVATAPGVAARAVLPDFHFRVQTGSVWRCFKLPASDPTLVSCLNGKERPLAEPLQFARASCLECDAGPRDEIFHRAGNEYLSPLGVSGDTRANVDGQP